MKPTLISAPTIITCHSNADWDGLSSMIGISLLFPDSTMIFPGSMEAPLNQFFTETASCLYQFNTPKEIDPASVRRIIVVDTQIRARVAHIQEFLDLPHVEVHVWDHHPTPEKTPDAVAEANETTATDNTPETPNKLTLHAPPSPTMHDVTVIRADFLRIGRTGSTCTLICQEMQVRGYKPTCQEATFLGLGIYGDTGAFTYTSTTPADFQSAGWLRAYGMDLAFIADLHQTGMTSIHIKVLNALIESATLHEVGTYSVILAEVTLDSFLGDFAYLAQKFMEMEACNVLFALADMEDKVQVVARSRVDAIDVGKICEALGGGGHRFAASASVKGTPVPELKDDIFQHLYAQVHPFKRAHDLMSAPAVGLEEQQSLRSAETVMTRYGLKAAPVFRAGTRHCVGYIEAQTASRAIAHDLGDIPVAEYMQRTILTVQPDTSLQRLMKIIVGAHQRLVPVVEKNEVIGVVTRTDLINMFVEDPAGVAIPRNASTRERNLAKLLTTRLPNPMLDLLRRAGDLGDKRGVDVYAVGGFVRDIILSRPVTEFDDVDLVVEGDGIAFARALSLELGGRVREHRAFMTALIIYTDETGKEQRLDVATARLEYYKYPAALPTVELSSIKMDLFRRDFTINAMALRLNKARFGNLVDFFGGQNDIQRKTIRIIHALSFVEDPTRIIRGVRFEQRYGFRICAQGAKLIKNALSLSLVGKLSGARILHELHLIFREDEPQSCLVRLNELGVLAAIHPDLALTPEKTELLGSLREVLDWYRLLYFKETPNLETLYLLALCSAVPTAATAEIFERLGLLPGLRDSLLTLRENVRVTLPAIISWSREGKKRREKEHPEAASSPEHIAGQLENSGPVSRLCTLLAPLSLDGALYLMARSSGDETSRSVSQYIYKWRQIKPDISGNDIRNLGLLPGPGYGFVMREVLAAKLDGLTPTREQQLALAQKLIANLPPEYETLCGVKG
ncbi:MAG: CBS domain-containing protein [Bilophila sp.]